MILFSETPSEHFVVTSYNVVVVVVAAAVLVVVLLVVVVVVVVAAVVVVVVLVVVVVAAVVPVVVAEVVVVVYFHKIHGAMGRRIDPSWWTHWAISRYLPVLHDWCTKAVECAILSVGWCI